MAKRKMIIIDERKCTGCGRCITGCPEGALQIIDGKARLVSDLLCDGLGACIGTCPQGAIAIEERVAKAYSETKVMEHIIKHGSNTIAAHLKHLYDHNERKHFKEAIAFLKRKKINMPLELFNPSLRISSPVRRGLAVGKNSEKNSAFRHSEGKDSTGASSLSSKKQRLPCASGCPGSRMHDFSNIPTGVAHGVGNDQPSALRQWPIQLHLVPPLAPYFQGKDVLLAADCVAYALANFHSQYLQGKSLAIACPKLDSNKELYIEKIIALIDQAKIKSLTIMIMEVPCCAGLVVIAQEALAKAKRKISLRRITVSITGTIINHEK